MSSAAVQAALAGPIGLRTVLVVAFAPAVFGGLLTFGLSAVVWLLVLSRIDVSYAYPCVALGIVLTMLAGHLMLGEALTVSRIAGLALIVSGVGVVALGR
ncbi:EamA family transporter [Methylobacterium soli]|uniref:EamA family transporter n=2 Tax=Methylobacterium soli TaxID=553447 RepID=A0A6L3T4D9_9HYPH|nr:EamA family transporter [Methylobacterium soli]